MKLSVKEIAVLYQLRATPSYGYSLCQGRLGLPSSTVYRVLARLHLLRLCRYRIVTPLHAPPRRVYTITSLGERALWNALEEKRLKHAQSAERSLAAYFTSQTIFQQTTATIWALAGSRTHTPSAPE